MKQSDITRSVGNYNNHYYYVQSYVCFIIYL
jgi:hypothetical protein